MNSKIFGSKVKGFTLIEMLIVIAIIAILAGSISLFAMGFQRDSRVETNNNKAQMVYTAFQNILINCEIEQDDTIFDVGSFNSIDKDIEYVEVYFEMGDAKVFDKLTVRAQYDGGSSAAKCLERGDSTTGEAFKAVEEEILSYLDNSFEGFGAVYIDFENYTVDSVVYLEPNAFDANMEEYTSGIGQFMSDNFDEYADQWKKTSSGSYTFRIANSLNDQKECLKYTGMGFGSYPLATDLAAGDNNGGYVNTNSSD